jgi:hypothetical protein
MTLMKEVIAAMAIPMEEVIPSQDAIFNPVEFKMKGPQQPKCCQVHVMFSFTQTAVEGRG